MLCLPILNNLENSDLGQFHYSRHLPKTHYKYHLFLLNAMLGYFWKFQLFYYQEKIFLTGFLRLLQMKRWTYLTAFSKKLFRGSATSLSSDIILSLSTRLMCENLVPFSNKRGLPNYFPELLVISYFINIQIIIVFLSFLFIQCLMLNWDWLSLIYILYGTYATILLINNNLELPYILGGIKFVG